MYINNVLYGFYNFGLWLVSNPSNAWSFAIGTALLFGLIWIIFYLIKDKKNRC